MAIARDSTSAGLSNAEIADQLLRLAQFLAANRENPFKIKAYRRAARTITNASESMEDLVRRGEDLTKYAGIGKTISATIREIVLHGTSGQLDELRAQSTPELAAIAEYPRLDPQRVQRIFKKLQINSISELKERLAGGDIAAKFGARMDQHVREALASTQALMLYQADALAAEIHSFLTERCGVHRIAITGDVRRRVELIDEISFLIETSHLSDVVAKLQRYGGRAELLESAEASARFALPAGVTLRIENSSRRVWGIASIVTTGSPAHLRRLEAAGHRLATLEARAADYSTEAAVYGHFGLSYIEPELREGGDEIDRAARGTLPNLVQLADIRGELHAHSISSDGAHTIEAMAAAAHAKRYEYIGITDHSQTLKIARGLSIEDLWGQVRVIDQINAKQQNVRVLKSAEVDILEDGSLDYPDDLLRALDYTICSIHSRFRLDKEAQTERLMRAMDNRYCSIVGHLTGRLLRKRPGYEIDIDRVIDHARATGCVLELNSTPDRLDVSAEHARLAAERGVMIAITTDAHSVRELENTRYGLDQARRAGLSAASVVNSYPWAELQRLLRKR